MANTIHKTEEEKREFFDKPAELDKKVEQLAAYILQAQHFVTFTGAGISTSAGIPDYRSGANTVLETGPGAWESEANIIAAKKAGLKVPERPKGGYRSKIPGAMPTAAHMALVELMNKGLLKHIISQNTDGLHRKSGIPKAGITEVHGNTNLEICKKCGRDYYRDFRVRTQKKCKLHDTGRICDNPACGGKLKDTIINFGENLRDSDLDMGYAQGQDADLMLCLGSSLRVTPAADMAELTAKKKNGKIVIVNLQKTPLSRYGLHIFAKIDDVMTLLMKKLSIEIPQFLLRRYCKMTLFKEQKNKCLSLGGITPDGGHFSIFTKVNLAGQARSKIILKPEQETDKSAYPVELAFQGHYKEPPLKFQVARAAFLKDSCRIEMVFDPYAEKKEVKDKKTGLSVVELSGKWIAVNVQDPKDGKTVASLEFKNLKPVVAAPKPSPRK